MQIYQKKITYFILIALVYILFLFLSINKSGQDGLLINDVSRLNPTYVKEIVFNSEIEGIRETLKIAREQNLNVSIAGKRHSMGGHAFYPGAVVLDMTSFNKILSINTTEKTVTVQSGATWKDVIEAVNHYNLSVRVMQAYNGFTVGGSLSVNVHESDPNYGQLIETVKSFRLLLSNGTILNVDRKENSELFGLVIGGYGLFGVILDVDLLLTDNKIYEKREIVIDYRDYNEFFFETKKNQNIGSLFARLSIAKDDSLLKDMVVTVYEVSNEKNETYFILENSSSGFVKKFVFGLSRKYDWGKKLRWYLQKEKSDLTDPPIISRNNLMNGDLRFLDYHSSRKTDILQEYFIPVNYLSEFIDDLREVNQREDLNLLSATIRYLPANNESLLSYSLEESFGIVLYFNVGLSEKKQKKVEMWTRELTDKALEYNGTYYLPYKLYASSEQIRLAYPKLDEFFEKKKQYDYDEIFMNNFYATYKETE
ncbi:FAD-binding oxidoreductase [Candidatus Pacearchaeota archaeon]|nr:FAD-binding oxidoreductase [Candidatus Pacearchaeota archaeon]